MRPLLGNKTRGSFQNSPRSRPLNLTQLSSTKSLADRHQTYCRARARRKQRVKKTDTLCWFPLRIRHRPHSWRPLTLWLTRFSPPPDWGPHLRLSPGYEPMHGSRHLNAAEVCRAGFWETPQRGRGVGTTADAGVGGASSASPVSGATSGGNLKVSQVCASGLRLFGLNRVLNDRCLYSCPLSNTGLNCAGPLILQFFSHTVGPSYPRASRGFAFVDPTNRGSKILIFICWLNLWM